MPQRPVELILLRQLATMLSIPVFLVDPDGTLLFFNEPAERLLGTRFEESERIAFGPRAALLSPRDLDDNPFPPEELPGMVAMRERRPVHRRVKIAGADGVYRLVEIAAIPIDGVGDRLLGSVVLFWESRPRAG